jgi:hypothetical protein
MNWRKEIMDWHFLDENGTRDRDYPLLERVKQLEEGEGIKKSLLPKLHHFLLPFGIIFVF